MYGQVWDNRLADQQTAKMMLAEWTKQLADFEDYQIERGVNNLEGSFPPSLPEFKKACLTQRNTFQQTQIEQADKKRLEDLGRERQRLLAMSPEQKKKAKDFGLALLADIKEKIRPANGTSVLGKNTVKCDQSAFCENEEAMYQRRMQMIRNGDFDELKRKIY